MSHRYHWNYSIQNNDLHAYKAMMEDDHVLHVYIGKKVNNSYWLYFMVDDKKNFFSELNNFYPLYTTLLDISVHFLTTVQPNVFSFYLDLDSEYGKKASSIYMKMIKRKWSDVALLVGYTLTKVEKDNDNDLIFEWSKIPGFPDIPKYMDVRHCY